MESVKIAVDSVLTLWQLTGMNKLRHRMNEQKLSNRKLASDVPCHFTLISRIASGQRTPSMKIAKRISELTGVSMEDLIAEAANGEKQ